MGAGMGSMTVPAQYPHAVTLPEAQCTADTDSSMSDDHYNGYLIAAGQQPDRAAAACCSCEPLSREVKATVPSRNSVDLVC